MTFKRSKIALVLSLAAALLVLGRLYLGFPARSIRAVGGERIYSTRKGTGYCGNRFGVYIPEKYFSSDALPLVVASHGANSDGPEEIRHWGKLAEKYGFIVIAPSYACATNIASDNDDKRRQIAAEKNMLGEILENAIRNLRIDRRHVLHTGFSGGGAATWYVATYFPQYFTAFCLRSANFYGRDFSPVEHLVTWRDVPVYIFWSRNDNEVIVGKGFNTTIGEASEALRFMESKKFSRLEKNIFDSGGHASRREEAAAWFNSIVKGKNNTKEPISKLPVAARPAILDARPRLCGSGHTCLVCPDRDGVAFAPKELADQRVGAEAQHALPTRFTRSFETGSKE